MRRTGLFINWKGGSKNDTAIKEFKKNGIAWEYNHFGQLTADFYGIGYFQAIDFDYVENDLFEICIA